MIMIIFKNIIDKLTKKNEKLKVKQQKIIDDKNYKNANISARIDKLNSKLKALNDAALRNDKTATNAVAEIDRLIKKNKEQMVLETNYYKDIVEDKPAKTACVYKKGVNNG